MTSYRVKNPTINQTPRVVRIRAARPRQQTAQDEKTQDRATQVQETQDRATQDRRGPRWTSRLRSAIRSAIYGFDAAALITHGVKVPPNHPARDPAAGHSFDIDV